MNTNKRARRFAVAQAAAAAVKEIEAYSPQALRVIVSGGMERR